MCGDLVFVNINEDLRDVVCYVCKSTKVNKIVSGTYCVACGKPTRSLGIVHLQAKIHIDKEPTISKELIGSISTKVLHLCKPFIKLYSMSVIGARELLACTLCTGLFKLNHARNLCDFTEEKK